MWQRQKQYTKIIIETNERVETLFVNLSIIPLILEELRNLRKQLTNHSLMTNIKLERLGDKMSELGVDFTHFQTALARQLQEIDTQIQQLVEAAQQATTVAELRGLIATAQENVNASTASINESADRLSSDNPVVVPPEVEIPPTEVVVNPPTGEVDTSQIFKKH